jgi:hypothetical protein
MKKLKQFNNYYSAGSSGANSLTASLIQTPNPLAAPANLVVGGNSSTTNAATGSHSKNQ